MLNAYCPRSFFDVLGERFYTGLIMLGYVLIAHFFGFFFLIVVLAIQPTPIEYICIFGGGGALLVGGFLYLPTLGEPKKLMSVGEKWWIMSTVLLMLIAYSMLHHKALLVLLVDWQQLSLQTTWEIRIR